jgi:hypothetical protein
MMAPMPLNYARRLTPSVIELIPPEIIDSAAMYVMEADVMQLLTNTGPASGWLLDASNVSSFTAFEDLFAAVKRAQQKGLKKLVLVVPTPLGQMTVESYLSKSPVSAMWFKTRMEALKFLKVLR